MLKNKKTLVVVISILVILIVLGIFYFVFWKNKGVDDRLTEEQKAAINRELAPDPSSKLITDNEKKQVEKDLMANSVNVAPLSESEINTIIDSLNNE